METIIQIVAVPILLVFGVLYYVFASRASSRRKLEAEQQLATIDVQASQATSSEENSDRDKKDKNG